MILCLLLAALAVVPADRLAMADRLFNKGKFSEAAVEYEALKGEPSIAADELLYRFAECDRALGRNESSLARYAELYGKHPDSKYAYQSRFMHAMGMTGVARKQELAALDTDRVPAEIRAAALYHLGIDNSDANILGRCVKADPKGKYADYARLRQGTILTDSKDEAERRKGVELLLSIAFSNKGELSEESLYLAAVQSYRDKKYGEAGSLFRRYLKLYSKGARTEDVRMMTVWSDFMCGRYADAAAACGDGASDDTAYVKASCAYATGDEKGAAALFRKYLDDYPQGKYRADAELQLARLEFNLAEKSGDSSMVVESAKRGYGLSKQAADALRLAWAYEKSGRNEDAIEEYVRIAREFKGSGEAAEALFRKAMLDAREERWNAVEVALAEALASGKCGKRQGEALYWRGIAAIRTDHEEEGIDSLRQALGYNLPLDEMREAKLQIADHCLRHGKKEESRGIYLQLVKTGACERMSASRNLAVGKFLGGESARACANALIKVDTPEWRQAGYALLGSVEEEAGAFTAAQEAYRKCLEEKSNVADAAMAALHLGKLESRAGEFDRAETTLKKAVTLGSADIAMRGEAYMSLAENSERKKDFKTACAYATVVTSLFSDEKLGARAKKILAAHPEAVE